MELRDTFENATSVNTSDLKPDAAGIKQTFQYKMESFTKENGTAIYFAIRASDGSNNVGEVSNIARAVVLLPPTPTNPSSAPPTPTNPNTTSSSEAPNTGPPEVINIVTLIVIIVCVALIIICACICITICVLHKQKRVNPETVM